jgi:hypothetical protein
LAGSRTGFAAVDAEQTDRQPIRAAVWIGQCGGFQFWRSDGASAADDREQDSRQSQA